MGDGARAIWRTRGWLYSSRIGFAVTAATLAALAAVAAFVALIASHGADPAPREARVFRRHSISFTSRGQASECRGGGTARASVERPKDAYGALRYLQRQPGIRPDRIALMGWSHGGGTVLFSIGPRGPASAPDAAQPPDFAAAVAFYPGWCNTRAQGVDWSTRIPLLVLSGADDVWSKAAPCEALMQDVIARGSPVTFHLYPGAVHDFDYPNLPVRRRPEFTNPVTHVVPITGTQSEARADAIERVTAFLAKAFDK